jgi:hypothetical protein
MSSLVEHLYSDKPGRYYIDGRRVSRDAYETAITTARMENRDHGCFMTKCKEIDNGRFHRINYSTIWGEL